MAEESDKADLVTALQAARKAAVEIATTVLVGFAFLVLVLIVVREFESSNVVIEPIHVQSDLLGKGAWSGEVIARRLQDAVNEVLVHAKRNSEFRKDATLNAQIEEESKKLASLSLPGSGFDFENALKVIRMLTRRSTVVIGGDLIADGKGWVLLLRSNRHGNFDRRPITTPAELDSVIEKAGWTIVGTLEPIIAAIAALEQKNPDYVMATILAKKVLEQDGDVRSQSRAHFVIGTVHSRQEEYRTAEQSYLLAIRLDARNAIAHSSLGYVLRKQSRGDPAVAPATLARSIANYRRATRIAPGLALAHNGLGLSLLEAWCGDPADPARRDEAISAFRQAVRLNRSEDSFQKNLAKALAPEKKDACAA